MTNLHVTIFFISTPINLRRIFLYVYRSQWPRGLRRRSADARLLRSWVRIPQGTGMFVCWVCSVLSGRGLGDELITRPEESYRCGASLCVIKKPRGRGGHSPRWAAKPEKIIIISVGLIIVFRLVSKCVPRKVRRTLNGGAVKEIII
jgi:hypothetical protein